MKSLYRLQYVWCILLIVASGYLTYALLKDPSGISTGYYHQLHQLQMLPNSETIFNSLIGYAIFIIIGILLPNIITFFVLMIKTRVASNICLGTSIILLIWLTFELLVFGINLQTGLFLGICILQGVTATTLIILKDEKGAFAEI